MVPEEQHPAGIALACQPFVLPLQLNYPAKALQPQPQGHGAASLHMSA